MEHHTGILNQQGRSDKTTSEGPLQFGDYYLIPGEAIKTYYGYKYAGIWGTAEAEEAAKYSQKPGQVHIAEMVLPITN